MLVFPNGKLISTSKRQIRIWNCRMKYKCVKVLKMAKYDSFNKLLYLNNGCLAVSACRNGYPRILILNCKNQYRLERVLRASHLYTGWVTAFVNMSDGKFASSYSDKTIRLWDINDNYKCCKTLTGDTYISALEYVSNYNLLLVADGKTIKVWDTSFDLYQLVKIIQVNDHEITCLLLLSNGYFAAGSYQKIQIFDLVNYECINTLKGHDNNVISLILMKDKRMISVASLQHIVGIWSY
jgi:WD40 repeat protein